MPRFGNPARSSIQALKADTSYDLSKSFKSYQGGYVYDKQENLILWGDLCGPKTYDDEASHGSLASHYLVGIDQSESGTKHGLYTPSTVTKQIDERRDLFCGVKCSFRFSGVVVPLSSPDSGKAHASGHYFVAADHDELTFNDSGSDKPFSISLWYQSLDPNAGGTSSTAGPISYLINKPYEYGLSVTGDRKLRFQLSDGTGSNTLFVETAADPMEDASISSTIPSGLDGGLNHIVITYDGSETAAGMKIYVNGENVTQTTGGAGSYTGMTNGLGNVYFGSGAGIPGTSLPLGPLGLGVATLSEPSIWNAEIADEDVKAVYHASLSCAALSSVGESGYTNLPPRISLRDFDNHPHSYPSVFRTGDRDRKGTLGTSFNDTSTLIFGGLVKDEFSNLKSNEVSSERIDKAKWSFTEGMTIRRETLAGFNGASFTDGVLVFSGRGNILKNRFIQTKQKVRNATIIFDVVQGPHNQRSGEHFLSRGLNLESGKITEKLYVEISPVGSAFATWQTIKTIDVTPDLATFYGYESGAVNLADVLRRDQRYIQSLGPGAGEEPDNQESTNTNTDEFKAFRKRIVIPFSEIDDPGEAYYVRIVQKVYDNEDKSVWGIGKISIESMNQDIRYPLLVDHDTGAGKKVAESFIATPHTRSDITAVGRTVSGISDTMLKFTPTEDLSPFNETLAVESLDDTNLFYKIGTEPQVLSGFSGKLADKTKLTLDISTYDSNYFGYLSGASGLADIPIGGSSLARANEMPLMGYYNHALRKWESVAKGYFWNCNPSGLFDHPFDGQNSIMHAVTSSAVGFGSFGHVAVETGPSDSREPEESAILNTYSRHITNFGFPFDGRYHASGSQVISATDIGITKPFLLEKVIFEFDGMFEYADPPGLYSAYAKDAAFQLKVLSGTNSENFTSRYSDFTLDPAYKYYLPTFFLLRQKKGYVSNFKIENTFDQAPSTGSVSHRTGSFLGQRMDENGTGGMPHPSGTYYVNIPGYYDIKGDSSKDDYVNTTRDLAAYGQLGFLVSGSTQNQDDSFINIKKVLEAGMQRDGLVVVSPTDDCSFTGSFRLGFSPQVTQQYESATCTSVVLAFPEFDIFGSGATTFTTGTLLLDNKAPRELEASRRLVNNYPGFQDTKSPDGTSKTVEIFNLFNTKEGFGLGPKTAAETNSVKREVKLGSDNVNVPSPYILMPGDELVIGLQYPLAEDPVRLGTVNNYNRFRDRMKMHGPAKIHFYGSLMSDSKEFHEYNNQNLTSDAIHEVIGGEKILDQFQTATRSELSGSYVDDWTTGTGQWQLAGATPAFPWLDAQFVPAIYRIGLPVFSKIGTFNTAWFNNTENFAGATWPHTQRNIGASKSASRIVTQAVKECSKATRFVQLKDAQRRYVDSLYNSGTFIPDSTFGTMQTDSLQVLGGNDNNQRRRKLAHLGSNCIQFTDVVAGLSGSFVISPSREHISSHGVWGQWPYNWVGTTMWPYYDKKRHTRAAPKYYYNYRHFGYSFDMLEQARDGRTAVPTSLISLNSTEARLMTTDGILKKIVFGADTVGSGGSMPSFDGVSYLPSSFPPSINSGHRISSLAREADFEHLRTDPPVNVQLVTTSSNPGTDVIEFVRAPLGARTIFADATRANPIFNTSQHMTCSFPYIEHEQNPYAHKA